MVEVPISSWEICRNSSPKPSTCLSSKQLTASVVLSRPVKPVPPVINTTCTLSSAIQVATWARILYRSSLSNTRSAKLWPATVRRSISICPEVSVAWVRVSLTVNTAMLSGTKAASALWLMAQSGYDENGPKLYHRPQPERRHEHLPAHSQGLYQHRQSTQPERHHDHCQALSQPLHLAARGRARPAHGRP